MRRPAVGLSDARISLHCGDARAVLPTLPADSIDAVVTDPPYHLVSTASGGSARIKINSPAHPFYRPRRGFMGTTWDGGGISFDPSLWAEVLRVAKPGAHLLAFGGPRTYHRLVRAVEDAGWEIRDCLVWAYASGLPKSRNLSGRWAGWGSALKPAWEPIVLARRPFTGNLAANVLRHGTGAINVEACRIPAHPHRQGQPDRPEGRPAGRWPSNVLLTDPIFDGQAAGVVGGGATTSGILRAGRHRKGSVESSKVCFGRFGGDTTHFDTYGDTGGYSRFFLVPKASRTEREHGLAVELAAGRRSRTGSGSRLNTHPTVKPVALIAHLLRLVTPPGGLVLDPFVGSGTTAVAAHADGFGCIGIEIDPAYADIASARMRAAVRRDTAKRTG